MLNTAPDGQLHGIRVMWRINIQYIDCQYILRVELNENEVGRDVGNRSTDKSVDFDNEQLDCNREYRPRVRRSLSGIEIYNFDYGIPVFYGGNLTIKFMTMVHTIAKFVWLVLITDYNFIVYT